MHTPTRTHRTRSSARTAAIALLALGALAGTACSSGGDDVADADERPAATKAKDAGSTTDGAEDGTDDEAAGDEAAVEAATGTPTAPGAPTPPAGTPSAPPAGGGSSGGGAAPTPPAPPATPAPTITSFVTPDSIDCHNGDFQQFTATFSTSGAVKTTISIDGPGIYAEYGPSGSADLPFNCSSPHTFLLTAHGSDGQTATRQVTLHPRNAQTSAPEDVSDV